MASSAIWTTYSTTAYLKYPHSQNKNNNNRKSVSHRHNSPIDRATMLVLSRFLGSSLLGLLLPLPPSSRLSSRISSTISSLRPFLLPSTFLFLANYCNSVALDRIGISLTYTSKCGIPLVTVLLSLVWEGTHSLPPPLALYSLVPIVGGIGAASWNAPSFEVLGFAAAMVSCVSQACLNVCSRRVMIRHSVDGMGAQRVMVCLGFCYAAVMTTIRVLMGWVRQQQQHQTRRQELSPWGHTLMAVLAYHVEYCLSFIFVKLVQPITYGTCDALRRLFIIMSGKVFFGGDRFTHLNVAGIAMALSGALFYAYAANVK